MFPSRIHTARLLILASVTAVLLFSLAHNSALAKLVMCRSDPLVVLSDGTLIDVSADIEVLPFRVREVHYTLHVPQGLYPILVVHTPTWLTSVETFTFYDDMQPNEFKSTTTVHTSKENVGVTARMLVNLGTGQKRGLEGEPLTIHLRGDQLLNW